MTHNPAEALRECPFCGGEAHRVDFPATDDITDSNAGGSLIECTRCQACTAVHFDRKENLYSSWNDRRPALTSPAPADELSGPMPPPYVPETEEDAAELASDLGGGKYSKYSRPRRFAPVPIAELFLDILTRLSMASAETREARAYQIAIELRNRGLALAPVTPPPSPDVAGVVARLEGRAAGFECHAEGDGTYGYDAIDAKLDHEAATLLESLSAEKGNVANEPVCREMCGELAVMRAQAARIKELEGALTWYANPEVYKPHPHGLAFDDRDLSFRARTALTPKEKTS